MLFNQIPDYKFFKVFGCLCFTHLRPYNSQKFSFKSEECVFLGYSPSHKGYRCLSKTGRVFIARSFLFDETKFPYTALFKSPDRTIPHVTNTLPLLCPVPLNTHNSQNQSCPTPNRTPEESHHSSHHSPTISPTLNIPIMDPQVSAQNSSTPQTHQNEPLSDPNSQIVPYVPPHLYPLNSYSMVTRAKAGVTKPKLFNVESLPLCLDEPLTVDAALAQPEWKQAMKTEIDALIKNGTWSLVPFEDDMSIVQNKWVFRTKVKADGSLDKYKATLVAKGFQQIPGVDYF